MNIEDTCIEKFDIKTGKTQKYVFCGFDKTFEELGSGTQQKEEDSKSCSLQAHLTYSPTSSSIHKIRFCKKLVWDILERKRVAEYGKSQRLLSE